ncbi:MULTISPECIES: LacI family DNA-binding transcriptional regulator [Thermoanaerobacterium]|uniref:LacI family transcriptional regulator n=2 Tax=Thermoanaerobacterium TaxID=28895 RepID=W9EDL2_9THEO|nr:MULTISPECIES: LacI family DNA-binding transcriptional regulator [Thermoanaerobacterium]AFK87263.1 transcriptional regulator, LacI family [Thermoanaerobacterium saccharolyticum JW/SL-YS485]ETO37839.1 LacI family transcriptional regulator [Thermoanaerobacterium aotearoense SCUT27]
MNSKEIAKIAGVSRSTVSRVINNYPNVPLETREKVLKVIKEYNYVPHASARMLRGKMSNTIGLVIVDLNRKIDIHKVYDNVYFGPFTTAVIDFANERGYNVLVITVYKSKDFKKVKEVFYNKTISGAIFIGVKNNDPDIKYLIDAGLKVVIIDQEIKDDFNNCIIVNADNFNGAYEATKHLIKLGHKKIAHISGDMDKLSGIERFEGYKKALKETKLTYNNSLVVKGNFIEEGGYEAIIKLFKKSRPTAIFISNDQMAIGAMKALNDLGYSIPDDISIIGFDDIAISRYLKPSLTTMKVSLLQMAEIAVNNLIKSIEDEIIITAKFIVPVELIERESCKVFEDKNNNSGIKA